jgi:hypothetical protein
MAEERTASATEAKPQRGVADPEAPFGIQGGGPTATAIRERREAVEKIREKREEPRKKFMSGKGGEAREFFDVESNASTLQELSDQAGAPKPFEKFTESEREKFLRDGELLPAPAKKEDRPATPKELRAAEAPTRPKMRDFLDENRQLKEAEYNAALDKFDKERDAYVKQQTESKSAEQKSTEHERLTPEQMVAVDREILDVVEKESDTWWSEPAHAEAVKTFPERFEAMQTSLTAEQKSQVVATQKAVGPISAELNRFLLNVLARTKNMGAVYTELLRQPALLWNISHDWERSKNWQSSPDAQKLRVSTDKAIRHMIKLFDKQAGSSNGNGAAPKNRELPQITRAGKPPSEVGGQTSAPSDAAEAALRRGDGEEYRRIQNEKDRESWRARHRRR